MTIEKNLIADETVKFESKKHWFAPIQASFVAILMVLGAAFLRWLSPSGDGIFGWIGNLVDLIGVGLVIAAAAWIIYNIVEWRSASFAVTNLRVMREEGLFKHRSSATMLSSLSDVKTDQSFIGKQLGFGEVIIYSQSGSAGVDQFRTITSPMAFRDAIMTEKSGGTTPAPAAAAATPAAAPAAAPTPTVRAASGSVDPATTLASLADLHDRGAITDEEYAAKKAELLARM